MNIRYMKFLFLFVFIIGHVSATTAFETPRSFTEVSKKAIPAVVSIKVKTSSQGESQFQNKEQSGRNSQRSFEEEFWEHFFGTPRRNNSQQKSEPQSGQASGFIISPDGYILTNSHVVRDANEITVTLNDDKEYTAKVIGEDPQTDLAVIKIDAANLPFLKLGDSDELEVGQWVVAVGTPLGLQATVTAGIVSAKGRNNLDLINIEDFIQTDAAINRGNSGGPLIDLKGDVIGINTAIVSTMGNGGGYMGIGFAIPSNIAQHIMDQLIETGEVTRGFMGVTLQRIDNDLALAFGLDKAEGALIAEVSKGSPAEQAGLKQGDVILKYNNQRVSNITSLRNAVALMKPGTTLTLSVLREGKAITIPIQIGTFPTEQSFVATKDNKLGFELENLTPELAGTLGLVGEKGVIISSVETGSPAAWAGIKKGALLIAVNHKKVASVDEAKLAIKNTEPNKPVLLLIKQGNATRFVSLKIN